MPRYKLSSPTSGYHFETKTFIKIVEEVYFLLTACIHYREHVLSRPLAQLRSGCVAYLNMLNNMLFFWGLKYKALSIGGVNIVIATVYNNLLSKY